MSIFHKFGTRQTCKKFYADQSGSAIPFIGLAVFMLVSATGSAIDMGRVQVVESRMQSALDAAGLAVGATISTNDIQAETSKYFYANFPPNYMGSSIEQLTAVPAQDNNIINLTAEGTVPMTFMKVVGINSVNVEAKTQVIRQSKGMELVMVIDTTGSMSSSAGGSTSKMEAAKTAAVTLLNTLYGENNNLVPNLWVGLVPFSQAVNVGTDHADWTENTSFTWGFDSWRGCVDARDGATEETDDPPTDTLFPKYYWPCDNNNQWFGTDRNERNCETGRNLDYRNNPNLNSYGPNKYCTQPMVPLVAEKSTVIAGINAMEARGKTHINLGAVWGWRMLSPRWRGQWGGQMDAEGLPLNYDAPLMNKVMVLMSDGDNVMSNSMRGAYWYLSDRKLGTTNSGTARNRLNDRTRTVCQAMKAQGIIIYTIALGENVSSGGRNLLRDCATSEDFYYLSPTTDDLQIIFRQIGDSLANLRISQ